MLQVRALLEQMRANILSQSSVGVRVVILDDGSANDTSVVADELAKADSRVQFR
jgi:hypothetical protein